MTVATTTNRIQYTGNGVTTAFAVPFKFFTNADIKAILTTSGVDVAWAETTNYTLTGAGQDAGGTLTALVAPANGTILTIYRQVDLTQETDYLANDSFPAEVTEQTFDRQMMAIQQLADAADRTITLPVTSTASGDIPNPTANTYLGWNSTADALENKTLPAGTAVYSTVNNTINGTATGEAVTPDSLAGLWEDAGNVTDGATINIGAGGSFNLITSTTAITAFAFSPSKAGRKVRVRFNTVRTLTYNATTLVLPTAANITTAAGDICEVEDRGSGNVRVNDYTRADGTPLKVVPSPGTSGQALLSTGASTPPAFGDTGKIAQVQSVVSTTYQTITGVIPDDDTIPQITEGDLVLTKAFTPKNAGSTLLIEIDVPVLNFTTVMAALALFRDSGANALCAKQFGSNTAAFPKTVTLRFMESAASVSARTYTARVGTASSTVYINGDASARKLGGVQQAIMTITEILP